MEVGKNNLMRGSNGELEDCNSTNSSICENVYIKKEKKASQNWKSPTLYIIVATFYAKIDNVKLNS